MVKIRTVKRVATGNTCTAVVPLRLQCTTHAQGQHQVRQNGLTAAYSLLCCFVYDTLIAYHDRS